MSSVYINDFDQPTYQYKYLGPINLGHVNIETLLTGFEPAYSQFIFLYTGKRPIYGSFERFGSMLPGTTPPPNAPAVDIVVEGMEMVTVCCNSVTRRCNARASPFNSLVSALA